MPGAGWTNPFPLRFGGGSTPTDDVYRAMRGAMGKGGSPADPDVDLTTIIELWRACKARVYAAVLSFDERAALQAFPDLATDLLPYYERTLFVGGDPTATDEDRRDRVRARWVDESGGTQLTLEQKLQLIDSRFSIATVDPDETDTTNFGRRFQDLTASEPFNGGRRSTLFPNYSTEFRMTVLLDTGGGSLGPVDIGVIAEGKRLLVDAIAAWEELQVLVGPLDGFQLDGDPLDFTALYP